MEIFFPGNPFVPPNIIAIAVMVLWIPVVLYLFQSFPAKRAVVISFLVAWLFLPQMAISLPGLPDYTKVTATGYGILLATFIFDVGRFQSFRLGWLDVPMLIWCICPFFSSMANDLGPYDGFSSTLTQIAVWGVPYFLGRIYLNDPLGLRQLAIGMFAGGLAYVPLCLFEVRMSPQLHAIIYGGHAFSDFSQSIRYDGFRPTVFMIHGLAVGAWMMAASLIGLWLWQAGTFKKFQNIPMNILVVVMLVTLVLMKSTGALALMVIGVGIFVVGWQLRTSILVPIIAVSIAIYLYFNSVTETYFTDQLIGYASQIFDADRVQSLEFRFNNEELLSDRAKIRMIFGWAGWGRALIFDAQGKQLTIQDSLWIIAFGHHGLVGLTSLFSALLLPVVSLFWTKCPAKLWMRKDFAPVAVLGVTVLLYTIDSLLNAMINPVYVLACGGIAGYVMAAPVKAKIPKVPLRRPATANASLMQQR